MSKEYEIKTKMEQKQLLLLKMFFLLGYKLKIYLMGRGGGGMSKFLVGGEGTPPISQQGKP